MIVKTMIKGKLDNGSCKNLESLGKIIWDSVCSHVRQMEKEKKREGKRRELERGGGGARERG